MKEKYKLSPELHEEILENTIQCVRLGDGSLYGIRYDLYHGICEYLQPGRSGYFWF